jgi:hypothetical protein
MAVYYVTNGNYNGRNMMADLYMPYKTSDDGLEFYPVSFENDTAAVDGLT